MEVLGAKVQRAGPLEIYQLPRVHILLARGTPSRGNDGTVINHLGFKVQDLEAKGVKFDMRYRSVPSIGLSSAFLTDPWAVYIELTEGLAALDKKQEAGAP